jgi:hypothetical protein
VTIQPYTEFPEPHYQPTDTWVPVLQAVGDLANKIAGTEFVGKGFRGKPASTAAAILTGRELGLGPMASLRGLQVIDGSVSMTAQMMAGKILAAGHRIEWVENTDKAAEVRITRGDGLGEATARFTIADAQRAGLAGKTNWQRYPRAMCRARALSECAGMIASDVILGLETSDTDPTERPTQPVQMQTVQLPQPAPETPTDPPTALVDTTTGEITAEPPAPDVEPSTPAQMRKIGAQIGDWERLEGGRLSKNQRRDFIRTMAGLDKLDSAKDLTKQQAGDVIETLDLAIQARKDQPQPVTDSEETEGAP